MQAARLGGVGRVTLGFAGTSNCSAMPVLTRAVTSEHPGIELVLEGQAYAGEALGRIAEGSLDLAFVALPVRAGTGARVSLSYHLCTTLFAGTAPIVAQYLLTASGSMQPR
ncbi:hypothetical protein VT50_0203380 [Streptomyces antioxidans]|uniref:LysR substrate-binding domain-containing protein n=1 Tax=Streptomyces antioxidans TaxID=1507734 RepID=A0A1V4DCJ7_9ACTN|nr:hypothetical protein VT50_0203380 [Streptomyces antioxidans]